MDFLRHVLSLALMFSPTLLHTWPTFKSALVTPLLTKPNIDPGNLSNFRPISNLTNISKILERFFFLPVSRTTLRPLPTSVLISQLTVKAIPLKLLLPPHWTTSSHPLTMAKPTSLYAFTSLSAAFDSVDHQLPFQD